MPKTKSAAKRNGNPEKVLLLISLSVLTADQLLKFAILAASDAGKLPFELLPGILKLDYVTNTGIAFGLFQGNNAILVIVSMIAAAFLFFYGRRARIESEAIAVAAMLGGTAGNLVDRVLRGAVVDYVAVRGIPTFNLADAALTAGVALIIAGLIMNSGLLKRKLKQFSPYQKKNQDN